MKNTLSKNDILFSYRVLHSLLLQLYLQLGMKLRNVQRIVTFIQGDFMKNREEYYTKKRSSSKTEFEKSFWKLLVNAVNGKTIEAL